MNWILYHWAVGSRSKHFLLDQSSEFFDGWEGWWVLKREEKFPFSTSKSGVPRPSLSWVGENGGSG